MSEKSIKAVCNSTDYNHWGRTDDPKDLTVGKEYVVDYVVIHSSYTQTILVGDPEHAYNSCNFDFFDKDGKEIDIVEYFHHKIGTHDC